MPPPAALLIFQKKRVRNCLSFIHLESQTYVFGAGAHTNSDKNSKEQFDILCKLWKTVVLKPVTTALCVLRYTNCTLFLSNLNTISKILFLIFTKSRTSKKIIFPETFLPHIAISYSHLICHILHQVHAASVQMCRWWVPIQSQAKVQNLY